MKRYVADRMIRKSRYRNYFERSDSKMKKEILDHIGVLIKEEDGYCDRGNYFHLCDIFSAIAVYETLQNYVSEEEAFEITGNELYRSIEPARKRFQFFAGKPFFWQAMKVIVPIGFRLGSGNGWRFTWFKKSEPDEYRFETNECIYQKIFKARKLEKLGPMFCRCDVITYGELPGIDFARKGTLCYGDEKCDFRFIRHHGEFKRSECR